MVSFSSRYYLLVLLFAVQNLSVLISAAPPPTAGSLGSSRRERCANIRTRREWRDMTVEDRINYTSAVKCLQATPSSATRQGVKTRFDEFQASHIDLTNQIHGVGQFLAWHRQFVTLYSDSLRNECGYQGPVPYWDWSRDADSTRLMADSPVFDEVTGFGGNGVPGTYTPPATNPGFPGGFPGFPGFPGGGSSQGCVATGPFNTTKVNLGPGTAIGEHCLVRGINESMKGSLSSSNVDLVLSQTTFESFRTLLEGGARPGGGFSMGIHGAGHGLVGGEFVNIFSSPGDPLFYLHHGNLDRIWWKWQMADPDNRLYALSGPTTQTAPFTNITLDFELPFTTLTQPIVVREVMDAESEPGCFQYAD